VSGIVGVFHTDGTPVNPLLLETLTQFMAFRGPDARRVWTGGSVGLGHALLATTEESNTEHQPCTLDGHVWITADARIDARSELIEKLRSPQRPRPETLNDAELILAAYGKWGEACVEHLLGDFAFAIWDSPRQRLFCARDHFGVKPFYYARIGRLFLFSNTLDCLRRHPMVSDELNDLAIADFLLFRTNQDPATTNFADIQRLPAGHALACSEGSLAITRYWTLPVEGPLRYRRERDYVDHFLELFEKAVADRLRTDKVTVLMSGGLDSTSVAAVARKVGRPSLDLRALTIVYDRLIPDDERHFAALTAETLGMPVRYLVGDDHQVYEGCTAPGMWTCEPRDLANKAFETKQYTMVREHSRVAITGQGGDPAFLPTDLEHLLKSLPWWRVAAEVLRYVCVHGRRPPLGLRNTLARWRRRRAYPYPEWFNREFERRLNLQTRWEDAFQPTAWVHPLRPTAYASLTSPQAVAWWSCRFESYDAGRTGVPVEIRHPLWDTRLVCFLLALPPLPWCADKELLRVAVRGLLPEKVRLRRKSPLAADPVTEQLRHPRMAWIDHFDPIPELAHYVDLRAIPRITGDRVHPHWWVHLGPFTLNLWLRQLEALSQETLCHDSIRQEDLQPIHEAAQGVHAAKPHVLRQDRRLDRDKYIQSG